MKKKIIVKQQDEFSSDIFISIEETEEDPDVFLRSKGYTNFSWKYIEFGKKIRIKK